MTPFGPALVGVVGVCAVSPADVAPVVLPCPSEVGGEDFAAGGIESGEGLLDVLRELD